MTDKLTIFVIHPSDLLTDYEPYGDGLIVNEWLRMLAASGHRIHVAAWRTAIINTYPSNVTIHHIEVPVAARHFERLQYALEVRRLFLHIDATEHIDVAHQFNPVVPGLSLSLIGLGVPIVLGTFFPGWPQLHKRTPRVRAIMFAKRFISFVQQHFATKLLLSTPAASQALTLSPLTRRKLVVMPHAVDDRVFRPSACADSAIPKILFLANIMKRKGVFTLLEAFTIVHDAMPEAQLIFAGGGFDYDLLREHVGALPAELRQQIRFTGNVARGDVAKIMADCSVYCLPSHGEPYGMSALEAMACGKAMVVTNVGGLPHLVPDEGSIKVPPHEAQPLAQALLHVLRSPELQQRMGEANRRVVEQRHTPQSTLRRLETMYASAARRAKPSIRRVRDATSMTSHG